jgi:hypothetical protein
MSCRGDDGLIRHTSRAALYSAGWTSRNGIHHLLRLAARRTDEVGTLHAPDGQLASRRS